MQKEYQKRREILQNTKEIMTEHISKPIKYINLLTEESIQTLKEDKQKEVHTQKQLLKIKGKR